MKRTDYFWPRISVQIYTGIVFVTQMIVEFLGARLPGFEWVIYACAAAFFASLSYAFLVIIINALLERFWLNK
jgi:hypothetical protein